MKLLAIDTATEACSAAIYIDGEIVQRYRIAPREHSHIILPMIEELLVDTGCSLSAMNAIAFGRGPGSFMGVRIAAGVTQGIAFAHDLPVVPVSTLAAIAQTAHMQTQAEKVLAAIDARMNEVYWGVYELSDSGLMQPDGEECVIPPGHLSAQHGTGWTAAGTGWSSYRDELETTIGKHAITTVIDDCFPTAAAIATLGMAGFDAGNHVTASQAVPVYLRDNVAKKSVA